MSTLTPRRSGLLVGAALVIGLLAAVAPLPSFSFASVPVLERVSFTGTAVAGAEELASLQKAVDAAHSDDSHQDSSSGAATGDVAVPSASDDSRLGDERVSGTGKLAPFDTIGVLFDRAPSAPVLVRTRVGQGAWGEWRDIGTEVDEGPDADSAEAAGAVKYGSEPIWVGDATEYELNVAPADSAGTQVAVVRNEQQRVVTQATPMAGAEIAPPMSIRTRAAWGAAPTAAPSYGSTINLAVVHHTESSNDYTPAQVPGIIRSVQAFHMQGRGWADIAYNFVVDKFGTVWEGRAGSIDGPTIGAHTAGFNTNAVGVVVIGSYVDVQPSAASVQSVSQVIGWKLASYGVNPSSSVTRVAGFGSTKYPEGTTITIPRVVGHGDVGSTSCPGTLSGRLPAIRERAQQWAQFAWASSTPIGSVDGWGTSPGSVTAVGWAADGDATDPVAIRLSVGGVVGTTTTGLARPDVDEAVKFAGPNAGYQVVANGVPPGYQDACVVAVNQSYGTGDVVLGCRPVIVGDPTGRAPTGSVDVANGFTGGFDVLGTFAIPSPGSVTSVGIEVDGTIVTWVSPGGSRYSAHVVGVTGGTRKVCAVAQTSFGTQTRINCRLVEVTGRSAIGSVDRIEYADGRIHVSGWALDQETVGAIPVAVIFDGRRETLLASWRREDIAAAYPGYGPNHGFAASAPVAKGSHSVCVEFGGVGLGSNVAARCERIVVK